VPSLLFRRFLDNIHFFEIAIDGASVWTRVGFTQLEAKVKRQSFESADAARAHYDQLVAKWEKRLEEDKAVMRSVPHEDARPAIKKSLRAAKSEGLAPLRALYRLKLDEAKLSFRKPFMQQVRRDATSDDVARQCLAIAEKAFGVEFARAWSNGIDEIDLRDEFATFYESPMKVQRIAEKRVLGKLTLDDGPLQ